MPSTVPGLESTAFSTVISADQQIFSAPDDGLGSLGVRHAPRHRRRNAAHCVVHRGRRDAARFSLFYLLQNPGDTPANVTVRYLLQAAGSAPIERTYIVAPRSRYTIGVHDDPALANQELSAAVFTDGTPIVVERAMYRSGPRLFEAGAAATAAPAPATSWYFAEGATGPYFDEFLLLANPGPTSVTATVNYLLPDGSVITRQHELPGRHAPDGLGGLRGPGTGRYRRQHAGRGQRADRRRTCDVVAGQQRDVDRRSCEPGSDQRRPALGRGRPGCRRTGQRRAVAARGQSHRRRQPPFG